MTPLEEYAQEEGAAVAELRRFIGGAAEAALDGSAESLQIVDRYVKAASHDLFGNSSAARLIRERSGIDDIRRWLTVRISYYFALCFRNTYGSNWYLSEVDEPHLTGTPALSVDGIEVIPIEVAARLTGGELPDGLAGVFAQVEAGRRKKSGTRH